jgi:hypothetical protein
MVGMRTMDGPDGGRGSVSGPDGVARSPSELFDNLRLRLSQLAENHPSAPQRAEPDSGPVESPPRPPDRVNAPERDEFARPDVAGPDVARPDIARPDIARPDVTRPDVTRPEAEPGSDEFARPAPGAGTSGGDERAAAGAGGGPGELGLPGLPGASEPYRPWFLSGEPGAPWWAAGEDL